MDSLRALFVSCYGDDECMGIVHLLLDVLGSVSLDIGFDTWVEVFFYQDCDELCTSDRVFCVCWLSMDK